MALLAGLFWLPNAPWQHLTPSQKTTIATFFASAFATWCAVFVVFRFVVFRRRSHDFNNRMVSEVHVAVAIVLSSFGIDWMHPLSNVGGSNSREQVLTIVVSMAYFTYDFLCCLAHHTTNDVVTALHHIFTILGFVFGLVSGSCGDELVACLWLMELSNPFMHARELFKEAGVKNSALLLVNDLLFVVTFTVARMVVGPFVVYKTLNATSPVAVKTGAVAIQVVSVFWFYKILRFAYFKLFSRTSGKGRERREKQQ